MLIHLHPSAITDVTGECPTSGRSLRCLEHLLLAHRDGLHLVSMDPEDARRLQRSGAFEKMSGEERGTLDRIRATAAELQGLRDELACSMVLGVGVEFDGRVVDLPEGRASIQASLHHFDTIMRAAATVLLCENGTDSDFYLALGRLLLAVRRWRSLRLVCEPRGGGGSQLGEELARIAELGRIVLAIADGDQRCPGGARGSTARGLMEAARGRPAFQHAHVLDAREIENLVPLDVYRIAFEYLGGRARQLSALALLRPLSAAELAHADLKDGITLHRIDHRMERGSAEHATWLALARRRGRTQCWRAGGVECSEAGECECFVVERLGAAILGDVVRWLVEVGHRLPGRTAERLCLTRGSPLEEIADKVIAWTCASPPLLT